MDEIKTITICMKNINTQNKKKKKLVNMEGQVELKKECLKYFYGCWIRCIKKEDNEYYSGGFLTKITCSTVYLRTIQNQELLEFNINKYKFHVKQESEQYISMQQIELEKEKNNYESIKNKNQTRFLEEKINLFNEKNKNFKNEKLKFEKIKTKFFKLFENGKVKILL